MSYISIPRLAFSGSFEADVSTINNDVRHYNVDTFKSRFQDMQNQEALNGWWNPEGSGAFRLWGVRITDALLEFGQNNTSDPIIGLSVNAQSDQSSAKLVDLDPQMQTVSTIFGLKITLTDGNNEYMSGFYQAAPFRDIYFGRQDGKSRSEAASSKFTSILTNIEWTDHALNSPTLMALKAEAEKNENKLSINLMTYAYSTRSKQGRICGSIGGWNKGDPDSFLAGRRFVLPKGGTRASSGIGYFDAEVQNNILSLDLSNALPISKSDDVLQSIGDIFVGVLNKTDTIKNSGKSNMRVTENQTQGQNIRPEEFILIGKLPYKEKNWFLGKSAIASFELNGDTKKRVKTHPLALLSPNPDGTFKILIRESAGGFSVRTDNFVNRVDPPKTGVSKDVVRIKALQWGKAAASVKIGIELQARRNGGSGGGGSGPHSPQAPIPEVNFPANKVGYDKSVTSNKSGWARLDILYSNPGNPRKYIDGQLYFFDYNIVGSGFSEKPPLDFIVTHVREFFDVDGIPDWESDLFPFMKQYGNLYPIMSKHLFALSDPEIVKSHATLLTLAFSRPLDDPNHMPATRDLSLGKRNAILKWLAQYTNKEPPLLIASNIDLNAKIKAVSHSKSSRIEKTSLESLTHLIGSLDDSSEGKTAAMRSFLTTEINSRSSKGQS